LKKSKQKKNSSFDLSAFSMIMDTENTNDFEIEQEEEEKKKVSRDTKKARKKKEKTTCW